MYWDKIPFSEVAQKSGKQELLEIFYFGLMMGKQVLVILFSILYVTENTL